MKKIKFLQVVIFPVEQEEKNAEIFFPKETVTEIKTKRNNKREI